MSPESNLLGSHTTQRHQRQRSFEVPESHAKVLGLPTSSNVASMWEALVAWASCNSLDSSPAMAELWQEVNTLYKTYTDPAIDALGHENLS